VQQHEAAQAAAQFAEKLHPHADATPGGMQRISLLKSVVSLMYQCDVEKSTNRTKGCG
jgi:hypothetical protein